MKTEKEKVLDMFRDYLKSYFMGSSDSYYYISSCTLKIVLKDVFLMSEQEIKVIEDEVRGGLKK